jgi:hypothetical protein
MEAAMERGDRVLVRVYGGRKVRRVVVQVIDSTVVICKQEEYVLARQEMREPRGVGFPLADVIRA